jgi:hypothetical protein
MFLAVVISCDSFFHAAAFQIAQRLMRRIVARSTRDTASWMRSGAA